MIVVFMCGGEFMVFGISDVFLFVIFFYVKRLEDVEVCYLLGFEMVLLVDLVVNIGKSIVEFV